MRTQPRAIVFPTALDWMALAVEGRFVSRLSFGHPTPQQALTDVGTALAESADLEDDDFGDWASLVLRLQQYAEGAVDDFLDVELPPTEQTSFQRRVVELCRQIPFGSSLTYGELAEQAGHPRAARAVGNCMRTNTVPLIVPCHRVVGSGGSMRGYSAGEGIRMKLRLLELEAAACGA
jgi:methylated-DNA-[protein]-cysteine S-methyltransferase